MTSAVPPAAQRYVGVDLAWGQRARTGLAVLDGDGVLLDVATVVSDGEIVAWLRPHVGGSAVVGVDAPLIVNNPTGQRPCERLVGQLFGSYGAGAYPANLTNPAFADGTRARRLAGRLALEVDPGAAADRRMIEVYPHPAIVMLFGLPRRLAYKKGDVATRRAGFTQLVGHIESLAGAAPALGLDDEPWGRLRDDTAAATRQVDLDRAEDQLDAVVCAYVAMLFDRTPARTRVLGDAATGYIVTPVDAAMADRIDRA